MEYKLIFEDGSEALMHHGIKGMKWGVWNAETAARYRGSHSYRPTAREEARATERLKQAKTNLDGSDKSIKKYKKAERHYYKTISGRNAATRARLALAARVLSLSVAAVSGMYGLGNLSLATGSLLKSDLFSNIDPTLKQPGYNNSSKFTKDALKQVGHILNASHHVHQAQSQLGLSAISAVIANSTGKIETKYETLRKDEAFRKAMKKGAAKETS